MTKFTMSAHGINKSKMSVINGHVSIKPAIMICGPVHLKIAAKDTETLTSAMHSLAAALPSSYTIIHTATHNHSSSVHTSKQQHATLLSVN